ERAVFLLREAFDYDYDEIAAIVHKRPDNCRQIFARARKHLARDRPHEPPRSPAPHDVAREFMEAIITRDRGRLESLLAADVVFYSDGGGQVPAAINPILGPERVARFLLGVTRKQDPAIVTEPALINGQLGFVSWLGDAPYAATVLEFDGAVIRRLHSVRNPEKLTALRRTIAG
ncbi:MAG: RNA polymerase subunit sigma-24, partial [Myxococcales bacterium]|nr:RNA polymerase subunit sigma-24 [Myxococcales bacterium]